MFQHERAIRPGLAGLVLLCFLMPFVKITCGGQTVATMTGFDLAVGRKVEPPSMLGDQFGGQFGSQFGNQPGGAVSLLEQDQVPSPDTSAQTYSFDQTTPGDTAYTGAMATQDQNPMSLASADSEIGGDPVAVASIVLAVLALLAAFGASRKAMMISAITAGLTAVALFVMKTRFSGEMPTEAMGVINIEWAAAFWISLIGSAVLAAFTAKVMAENPPEREKPRLVIQSYSDNRPTQPTLPR